MKGNLTWGGEHTIEYTDEVLYNCIPEIYIILLTNASPINSIKLFFKSKKKIAYKFNHKANPNTFQDVEIVHLIPAGLHAVKHK